MIEPVPKHLAAMTALQHWLAPGLCGRAALVSMVYWEQRGPFVGAHSRDEWRHCDNKNDKHQQLDEKNILTTVSDHTHMLRTTSAK